MNAVEYTNAIMREIGVEVRNFLVDYRDKKGNDYNADVCFPIPVMDYDDGFIIETIKTDEKMRGYEVTAIHEILHGYTKKDLEAMAAANNPFELFRHSRRLY